MKNETLETLVEQMKELQKTVDKITFLGKEETEPGFDHAVKNIKSNIAAVISEANYLDIFFSDKIDVGRVDEDQPKKELPHELNHAPKIENKVLETIQSVRTAEQKIDVNLPTELEPNVNLENHPNGRKVRKDAGQKRILSPEHLAKLRAGREKAREAKKLAQLPAQGVI